MLFPFPVIIIRLFGYAHHFANLFIGNKVPYGIMRVDKKPWAYEVAAYYTKAANLRFNLASLGVSDRVGDQSVRTLIVGKHNKV